jgi:dihydrolipoamide dehydrogenase
VFERVRRERDRFAGFVVESTEALPPEQRLRGRARFVGPTTLEVDDHTRIEAGAIVIATGSTPVIPDGLAAARERVLVNDDVFELRDLPGSVAVVGGGVIALELGQSLARLGVRTQFFVRSERLGPLTDPLVLERARDVFGAELDLRLNTTVEARAEGDGVRLHWSSRDGTQGEETVDYVISAAGRRPMLDGLDLERAGLELDRGGVPLHDLRTGQCGSSAVFIAGDVAADRPLLHEASDEGRVAGFNAAHYPDTRAHNRRTPLSVAFTDPQIAIVGMPFAELDPSDVACGSVDYSNQGRARVMARNRGLVRVYGSRRDGRLLGGELFGPRVEHLAHLLAWTVQLDVHVDRALELPFYHPVLEEGLRTALRDLARELKLAPPPCAHELDCGPGVMVDAE